MNQGCEFLLARKQKTKGTRPGSSDSKGAASGAASVPGKHLAACKGKGDVDTSSGSEFELDDDLGIEARYAEVLKEFLVLPPPKLPPEIKRPSNKPPSVAIAESGAASSSSAAAPLEEHPPDLAARGARAGRQFDSEPWGPFSLSPLFRNIGGDRVQFGWGANCYRPDSCHHHRNEDDLADARCQKQVTYGVPGRTQLTDSDCKRLAKAWLILGSTVDGSASDARTQHVKGINPRKLAPDAWTHAELDRMVAELS